MRLAGRWRWLSPRSRPLCPRDHRRLRAQTPSTGTGLLRMRVVRAPRPAPHAGSSRAMTHVVFGPLDVPASIAEAASSRGLPFRGYLRAEHGPGQGDRGSAAQSPAPGTPRPLRSSATVASTSDTPRPASRRPRRDRALLRPRQKPGARPSPSPARPIDAGRSRAAMARVGEPVALARAPAVFSPTCGVGRRRRLTRFFPRRLRLRAQSALSEIAVDPSVRPPPRARGPHHVPISDARAGAPLRSSPRRGPHAA